VFFAFVIDAYSRMIVNWQFASHMRMRYSDYSPSAHAAPFAETTFGRATNLATNLSESDVTSDDLSPAIPGAPA
jgi:hypothetical protein